ncbi:hypothetical protein TNIN_455121, partial [Trichonephila inaurata madagascariensis]
CIVSEFSSEIPRGLPSQYFILNNRKTWTTAEFLR